jgi:hypothetical protein
MKRKAWDATQSANGGRLSFRRNVRKIFHETGCTDYTSELEKKKRIN